MGFDITEIPRSFTIINIWLDGEKEELLLPRKCVLGVVSRKQPEALQHLADNTIFEIADKQSEAPRSTQFDVLTSVGRFTLADDPSAPKGNRKINWKPTDVKTALDKMLDKVLV